MLFSVKKYRRKISRLTISISWQIPEESQLVFRAPAVSLECCCFIDDKEYLSGSDDGSLELWSVMRKKPTHIIKNAHPASSPSSPDSADEKLTKGKINFLNSVSSLFCDGKGYI